MAAGAAYLASIIGTEKDRVNCPFYFKVGACRHGDRCERRHLKPAISQTVLLGNMYLPILTPDQDPQQHFEDFYEDVFLECTKFGEVEELVVCENLNDHLRGNVYIKFYDEDAAAQALKGLSGRFYAGKLIVGEFSPVTDFRDACCRQHEEASCARGGYCNFLHPKPPARSLLRKLYAEQRKIYRKKKRSHSRSRSRSRSRSHSRERRRHEDDDRRKRRDDRDERHRDRDFRDRHDDRRRRDDRGRDERRDDRGRDRERERERDGDRRQDQKRPDNGGVLPPPPQPDERPYYPDMNQPYYPEPNQPYYENPNDNHRWASNNPEPYYDSSRQEQPPQ